jgi:hypothetical protein
MCNEFVKERLVAPSTAEFGKYSEDNVLVMENNQYGVLGYVDAQNSFGAMLRKEYACIMQDKGNDRWSLIEIEVGE